MMYIYRLVYISLFSLLISSCAQKPPAIHNFNKNANGCQMPSSLIPGFHTRTIKVDSLERSYNIYIPRKLSAKKSALLFDLHGRKGTGLGRVYMSKSYKRAEKEGFLLVAPNGFKKSWNAGVCCSSAHKEDVNDIKFIKRILQEMKSNFCIDSKRIYAMGFSNGARLSHRIGCELAQDFAAIGPVSGPLSHMNQKGDGPAFQCKPKNPMPVFYIHGTKDKCTPYAGGGKEQSLSVTETTKIWLKANQCSGQKTTKTKGAARCDYYTHCKAPVVVCTISEAGHAWPGGEPYTGWRFCGGEWNADFNATDEILNFFSGVSK